MIQTFGGNYSTWINKKLFLLLVSYCSLLKQQICQIISKHFSILSYSFGCFFTKCHYDFINMLVLDFGKKKQISPQSPELNFINTLKKRGNKRRKEMMSKSV